MFSIPFDTVTSPSHILKLGTNQAKLIFDISRSILPKHAFQSADTTIHFFCRNYRQNTNIHQQTAWPTALREVILFDRTVT